LKSWWQGYKKNYGKFGMAAVGLEMLASEPIKCKYVYPEILGA